MCHHSNTCMCVPLCVCLCLLITSGRTILLGLLRKQNERPVECIMCWTLIFLPKCKLQHLSRLTYRLLTMTKLHVQCSSTVNGCRGHRQGTKPPRVKIANRSHLSFFFLFSWKGLFHDSSVMVHVVDTALEITPTSCAYSLAVPFR